MIKRTGSLKIRLPRPNAYKTHVYASSAYAAYISSLYTNASGGTFSFTNLDLVARSGWATSLVRVHVFWKQFPDERTAGQTNKCIGLRNSKPVQVTLK